MDKFPWDDDAITGSAQNATNELPCSMSARELGALGLPVDDPFWMTPEAFDAHLAEVDAQQGEQANRLGPDAPQLKISAWRVPAGHRCPHLTRARRGQP